MLSILSPEVALSAQGVGIVDSDGNVRFIRRSWAVLSISAGHGCRRVSGATLEFHPREIAESHFCCHPDRGIAIFVMHPSVLVL